MPALLQVALGGALGATLRYLAVAQVGRWLGLGFPWGTMAVNLLGSFMMGAIFGAIGRESPMAPFLMAGLLGGFTTFSAFSLDVLALFDRGAPVAALAYVLLTVLGTVLLCFAGYMMTRGIAA